MQQKTFVIYFDSDLASLRVNPKKDARKNNALNNTRELNGVKPSLRGNFKD